MANEFWDGFRRAAVELEEGEPRMAAHRRMRRNLMVKAGDKVPKSRPRSDGLAGNVDDTHGKKEEPVVDTMFARKLSKEEKKAALEAKRAARAAKKAGGDK